ncbi:MAG: hypothetical protein ABFC94_09150 [Syntrophomonas sp.]
MNEIICQNINTRVSIADKVTLGKNIIFGSNCINICIGYGCFLGDDLYIDVPELKIGDYSTIHRGGTIHGYKQCSIGHNCWIGQYTIIDSIGGVQIANNVGIGASSQLWSHIKFGDTLEGCNWNKSKKLIIEDDVWIVGHCIVSPIRAEKKSMLLVGSVATNDMYENHIYAGSPAKDITESVGNQFVDIPFETKKQRFFNLYSEFMNLNKLYETNFRVYLSNNLDEVKSSETETFFDLNNRMYLPSRSKNEYKFMKYLLYDKAKFIPYIRNP